MDEAVELLGQVLKFLVEVNANPLLVESEKWREIDKKIDAFKRKYGQDQTWLKQEAVRFGTLSDTAVFWKKWDRALGYDPQPFIEQLDIPMLYIFAENDKNVPTASSVQYLESLQGQSHSNIEIRVIPGVEHSMLSPEALIHGSHPEFINVIGPWVVDKLGADSRSE